MSDPRRIVMAGDWHGNVDHAVQVIEQLPTLLPDEEFPLLLHLGDFGIWPGISGLLYKGRIIGALKGVGARLWFIDGNHDDHDQLGRALRATKGRGPIGFPLISRDNDHCRLYWLPRGQRWTWHERTWLALGGATSVDRRARRQGISWWRQEAIMQRQARDVCAAGPADVMVCHDAPAGVPLRLGTPPGWWEMKPADDHRELLGSVVDEVQPRWLFHGHYHLAHDSTVARHYGPLRVTGLDQDGALRDNFRVLDVESMEWVAHTIPAAVSDGTG